MYVQTSLHILYTSDGTFLKLLIILDFKVINQGEKNFEIVLHYKILK
jgi:hypothetical protein